MIETSSRLLFRYILTLSELNIFCDISNSTIFLSFSDVDTENAHHTEKVLICVFTVHTRYFIGHAKSDNRAFVSFTNHFLHFSVSGELHRQSWRDWYPARRRRVTFRTAVRSRCDVRKVCAKT